MPQPPLDAAKNLFIRRWGEMGASWGISRTMAEIHALLYLSEKPLHAEEITDTLSVARSNVSNSLKELQGWGIVKVVHVLGDRRAHYESMTDVWKMFEVILDERKKRECDPTLAMLRALTGEAKAAGPKEAHTHKRLREMLGFFESMSSWYAQMRRLPTKSLIKFVKTGDKVRKFLGLAS